MLTWLNFDGGVDVVVLSWLEALMRLNFVNTISPSHNKVALIWPPRLTANYLFVTLTKIDVQDGGLGPLHQYVLLPRLDHAMEVADCLPHHGSHLLSQPLQQTNADETPGKHVKRGRQADSGRRVHTWFSHRIHTRTIYGYIPQQAIKLSSQQSHYHRHFAHILTQT